MIDLDEQWKKEAPLRAQPPQIDADELERRLLRKHDVQSGIAQCRLKNPDGPSAVAALTTLRTEKQALMEALEGIRSCYPKNSNAHKIARQALAGKDT